MPIRMLRDWTNSDKIDSITYQAEVFFTRLIMKVDDYGCFYADNRLLKANLFPLKLDKIREADITRWTTECEKAGLIVLYEANQKKYLQILEFRQRLDKSRAKFPLPTDDQIRRNIPESVNEFPAETESRKETETEKKGAKALVVADATPGDSDRNLKKEYEVLVSTLTGNETKVVWAGLRQFIEDKKPKFIEPYHEAWNLFAANYKLAQVDVLSDSRRKKFKTRINETGFDFLKILEKIKTSPMLRGIDGNWKVTFDWILENDNNYAKILNGNYE